MSCMLFTESLNYVVVLDDVAEELHLSAHAHREVSTSPHEARVSMCSLLIPRVTIVRACHNFASQILDNVVRHGTMASGARAGPSSCA
jgi:hypothetical protein